LGNRFSDDKTLRQMIETVETGYNNHTKYAYFKSKEPDEYAFFINIGEHNAMMPIHAGESNAPLGRFWSDAQECRDGVFSLSTSSRMSMAEGLGVFEALQLPHFVNQSPHVATYATGELPGVHVHLGRSNPEGDYRTEDAPTSRFADLPIPPARMSLHHSSAASMHRYADLPVPLPAARPSTSRGSRSGSDSFAPASRPTPRWPTTGEGSPTFMSHGVPYWPPAEELRGPGASSRFVEDGDDSARSVRRRT
jgi:hypothetical protein